MRGTGQQGRQEGKEYKAICCPGGQGFNREHSWLTGHGGWEVSREAMEPLGLRTTQEGEGGENTGQKSKAKNLPSGFFSLCFLFLTGQSLPKIGERSLSLSGSGVVHLGSQKRHTVPPCLQRWGGTGEAAAV